MSSSKKSWLLLVPRGFAFSNMLAHIVLRAQPLRIHLFWIAVALCTGQPLKTSGIVTRGEVPWNRFRLPVPFIDDETLSTIHVLVKVAVNEPNSRVVGVEPHHCCSERWDYDHVFQYSTSFPLSKLRDRGREPGVQISKIT